jgi:hypothetical protein
MTGADPMAGRQPVRAGYDDIEALSQVIAGACHDLPASRWLVSSPGVRRRIIPRYFALHAGVPYRYLAILAVLPGRPGRGIGSVLLVAHHGTLDDAGEPGYAAAVSMRGRDFCLRHGCPHLPGGPLRVPHGPLIWPMRREPAPVSALRDSPERRGRPQPDETCGAGPGLVIRTGRPAV